MWSIRKLYQWDSIILLYNFFIFFSQRVKLTSKISDEYGQVRTLPEALVKQQKEAAQKAKLAKKTTIEDAAPDDSAVQQLIDTIPKKSTTEYVCI